MNDCSYRVGDVLSQALEIMAFLDLEPSGGQALSAEQALWSEIQFRGPREGTLVLIIGQHLARLLAQTISAQDQVSARECLDAVQELTNVTCGLILPEIALEQRDVFNMSVPQVHGTCTTEQIEAFLADPRTERYCVNDEELAVRLALNP